MIERSDAGPVSTLELTDVTKVYGSLEVLGPLTFSVPPGEFIVILGPSGCGKSTLLSMIAGVDDTSAGEIDLPVVEGRSLSDVRMMVFQQDGLLPWRTVLRNVGLGLEYRKVAQAEIDRRVSEVLSRVGLAGFERYYPHQLSGGMRQRAALARALVMDPEVLLLDEPFGALDAITRLRMQHDLLELWESMRRTVLLVTHDVDEALYLADRILVLSERPGRIILDKHIDLPRPRKADLHEHAEIRATLLEALDLEW